MGENVYCVGLVPDYTDALLDGIIKVLFRTFTFIFNLYFFFFMVLLFIYCFFGFPVLVICIICFSSFCIFVIEKKTGTTVDTIFYTLLISHCQNKQKHVLILIK